MSAQQMILVELDLYSGRPNPRFGLTANQSTELDRRLTALPASASGRAMGQGLGYRGIRVTGGAGFAEIFIAAGVVEIHDRAGAITRRSDPCRSLERWLIDVGAGAIPIEIPQTLRDELAR